MVTMAINSSLIPNLYEDADSALYDLFNITVDNLEWIQGLQIVLYIIFSLNFLTCIFGIVGNGFVIWLLGFCMKRNPFTTYILNLAIADIGVLILSFSGYISAVIIMFVNLDAVSPLRVYIFGYVWALFYMTDQFLLTTISIDRCVAVLFPVWHRCHRRPRLSGIACGFIWVLSFLLSGLDVLLMFMNQLIPLQFILNVSICTPLMAISAIILFVKISTMSQQHKQGKVLMTIFLALFLFLIFGFPMNYFYVLCYYDVLDGIDITSLVSVSNSEISITMMVFLSRIHLIIIPAMAAFACTVLNCSVNPLIYFLVGRDKKSRSRLSMKVAFQRLFKDEENCRGQEGLQAETNF